MRKFTLLIAASFAALSTFAQPSVSRLGEKSEKQGSKPAQIATIDYQSNTTASKTITLPFSQNYDLLKEVGASATNSSSMPKLVPIPEKDAIGHLSGKDTVFLTYKQCIDTCDNVYAAGGKLKFSTGSAIGMLRTLPVNTNGVSRIKVSMRATAWAQTSTKKNAQIKITYGNQSKTIDIEHKEELKFPVTDTHLVNYYETFDAIAENTPIILQAMTGNNLDIRFFLDDLAITEYTSQDVDKPTITPGSTSSIDPIEVSIAAMAGASIRYTLDGTDPTTTTGTVYTAPFTVSSNITVKAIAYKGSNFSPIASESYEFPVNVADIATLRGKAADNTTIYKLVGNVVLTLQSANRQTKYIQDATGAIVIDDNSKIIQTTFVPGDEITGIYGTLTVYNGMMQFIPIKDPGTATANGKVVEPVVITLDQLGDYQAKLVTVKDIEINGAGNFKASTSYKLTAESSPVLRTQYSDLDYIGQPIPTGKVNVTGVVLTYNTTQQLIPRSYEDIATNITDGIGTVNKTSVYSVDGVIFVPANQGELVTVFRMNGMKLYEAIADGETIVRGIPAGELVIVKFGKEVVKVMVR